MSHLFEVRDLITEFVVDSEVVRAVDGISYYVDAGEIVGIVGESGSGKSVSQFSALQLIPCPPGRIVNGEVLFDGRDILKMKDNSRELREIRGGQISVVFQEPMTALNPVLTVGRQIGEVLKVHTKLGRPARQRRILDLLQMVGIPDPERRINSYPHELSGGTRQRVMMAMAVACEPRIIVADEPTTALDVTTQAQLLELLEELCKRSNVALIFITHNLGIIARHADRIYVMYAGRMVESGTCSEIFSAPSHPYTKALLEAVPRLDDPRDRRLVPIDGLPPDGRDRTDVCAFLPRCRSQIDSCISSPAPRLRPVGGQQFSACHRMDSNDSYPPPCASSSMSTATACPPSRLTGPSTILEVQGLSMSFPVHAGIARRHIGRVEALSDVSFAVRRGETFGIVGESGCGKTTLARCILRLCRPTGGRILFQDRDLAVLSKRELRPLRRNMSMVFQDPFGSLDPRRSAGDAVAEPLKVLRLAGNKSELYRKVDELLEQVGIDRCMRDRLPHEFSGGQRQRIGIARALACHPSLIVCDEPISALDVSIQAQIINLLKDIQAEHGITYLLIAHDLSVVRHICDSVAVMYMGRIVEIGDWYSIYSSPRHPYTQALLSAVPVADPVTEAGRKRILLCGEVPSVLHRPEGCEFHPRCSYAQPDCSKKRPPLHSVGGVHEVACALA